jgi:hypothetical protein
VLHDATAAHGISVDIEIDNCHRIRDYSICIGRLYCRYIVCGNDGTVDLYPSCLGRVMTAMIPCVVGGLIAGYAAAEHYGRFAWYWGISCALIILALLHVAPPSYGHSPFSILVDDLLDEWRWYWCSLARWSTNIYEV